jgi:hypothetical protein
VTVKNEATAQPIDASIIRAVHSSREMFFGELPKFDSILALIKEWVHDFNRG